MLDQRLSNEQSNVGPTKYVAVGPTLNQRLGFGWRMVSVLAGVYMDGLSEMVNTCQTGCYTGVSMVNHLMYADPYSKTSLAQ